MGRPKGSKNRSKDEAEPINRTKPKAARAPARAPAQPPPPAGHNGLNDDEQRMLLVQGCVALEKLTKQIDSLSGQRRAERAKLKVHGLKKHIVDHALARRKAQEIGKLTEELQKTLDCARVDRWLNIQPGLTADLFSPPPEKVAYEAGKLAGMEGLTAKPPEGLNQADAQRWLSGWHDAQDVLASGFMTPPAPNADEEPVTEDVRPRFVQKRESDAIDSLLDEI